MRFSSRDCFPLFLTLLFAALFSSCQSGGKDDALSVSREDIRDYDKPEYSLKSRHIRQDIRQLLDAEQARMYADNFTRAYYREERPFVWITRPFFIETDFLFRGDDDITYRKTSIL